MTILLSILSLALVIYIVVKAKKNVPSTSTTTTTLLPPDENGCAIYKFVVTDQYNFLSYVDCNGESVQDSQLPVSYSGEICCKTGSINASGMELTYLGRC